ncbi:CHAD domain-containing protein [Deinococcus apachensis]|uniref:CHAD domain-containing protein n=1 Tax=Deinococcus apachensis TaxID=309886 RepID=UPI0003A86E7E|nr:CHAD domain-containing protein [Deinococcus apachensis]
MRGRDAAGRHLQSALEALQAPAAEIQTFQLEWQQARDHTLADVAFPKLPPEMERPKRWKARVWEALTSDAEELQREASVVLTSENVDRWNEWRKHLKRYRYTLELLEDAPQPLLDVLEALGRMQDAQELLTREVWLPAYIAALIEWRGRRSTARRNRCGRNGPPWPSI